MPCPGRGTPQALQQRAAAWPRRHPPSDRELWLSPATQMHKEAGTPCTPGSESGLPGSGEGGEEGPRSRPVTLRRLTQPPAPLQPTRAPEPEGAPPPRSRRAHQRASQFRPAHRRTTARARRAPAEPLHGSLFDSSHPDIPAPPPRARASRSARGGGAGPGKAFLEPGQPFTCRIFDVGEGDRPP